MPTPVNVARQCLTPEASTALDEAVNVARRRCHAQTTSLHVVSAFLSLPSSILRDACTRTRNTAYSPRVQFKALELCFSVALDRIPSSQNGNEPDPPISNSLMAAIKRSQANQRRNPESFHLHQLQQQQQQQQSPLSCVKVELQQFILSILDDPVVSRVFGESGFRSCDIKYAMVRPPPSLLRYTNSPVFLCNLSGGEFELGRRSFSFPFSGVSELSERDGNCRRIAEVLARKKGRNPLLVGVGAKDAIQSFAENIKSERDGILPVEISRLSFYCIEKEVSEFVTGTGCERLLRSKIEELGPLVESCSGSGVVVSFGDLKSFTTDGSVESTTYVISRLTKLLDLHSGDLWFIGTVANYETYLRFLAKFPSIEKDWDLQLLPITSLRPSMGGYYSRPHSSMESFVPLGGFFSTSPNLKGPLGSTYQPLSRCHLCNEKYEQEVSAFLKGASATPVMKHSLASLPSWLQTAEFSTNNGLLDVAKAKDDGTILNAKVTGLQKKWNDFCQRLHSRIPIPEGNVNLVGSRVVPCIIGFPLVTDRKEGVENPCSSSVNASSSDRDSENYLPSKPVEVHMKSHESSNMSVLMVSKTKNESHVSKLHIRSSKGEPHQRGNFCSPPCSLSISLDDNSASPSSTTSVTTDLGLGTLYSSSPQELMKPSPEAYKCLQDLSISQPTELKLEDGSIHIPPAQYSPCSKPYLSGQFDSKDFKMLLRGLMDKVGRQDEVIYTISRTLAFCRTGKERRRGLSLKGDVWFSFLGPDKVAKRKIAVALAEIIFGSSQSLLCVDLASQDGISQPHTISGCQQTNGYDVNFRGKTVIDYIAGEIRKNPFSVIYLENVDKADLLAQKCLFQAIRTGKFSDSHGREIGISNAIFVVTSGVVKSNETSTYTKKPIRYLEENILEARSWQMQVLIKHIPEGTAVRNNSNVSISSSKWISSPAYVNKRKLIETGSSLEHPETLDNAKRIHKISNKYLDLNLPIEDLGTAESDIGASESDLSISDDSEAAWFENFLHLVDETVVFQPYDFDSLADEMLTKISDAFQNVVGSKGLLEIDSKVMEQILATSWFSNSKHAVEYWVKEVLTRTFAEARERYSVTSGSILNLVACEGLLMEDQTTGVCLPARINLQ